MELFRQLATFREVMRSGSISEAARTLGRTQPAVSSTIAGLETELELKLFVREQGRLVPTPEAEFFLEEAEAISRRVFATVRAQISEGEAEGVASQLPKDIAQLWRDRPL